MNNTLSPIAVLCVCAALTTFGCRQKADATTELEKAASPLINAAPPPPGVEVGPAPGPQMKQALEAYKAGKLEDTVTHLQNLRATGTMTPQQNIALNDAMAMVMTDIYTRAAKGDARAIQAVKRYQELQNKKR